MILKTVDIFKTYQMGEVIVRALDGVSFSVEANEMIAITGSSGSGKSTLMHILGCLDIPDNGNYFLDGEDVSKMSNTQLARIRNKKIGFVFQSFNLLPKLTAQENVELPLLYSANPNAKELAHEALRVVGLADRAKHEPNQLSGGQRQRVAIARAIVTNPAIILADEPTGNLDSESGSEILKLFENLNKNGRTIVIVTHDEEVAEFCHRRIKLKDGRIVEEI